MDRYDQAELSVIGSMLMDPRCVPAVLARLSPEDFQDGACRSFFTAIRALAQEGKPIDRITVMDRLKAGEAYAGWVLEVRDLTPTAANVGAYIPMVRERAVLNRFHALCSDGLLCADVEQAQALARSMAAGLSQSDKMPRKSAQERFSDLYEWLKNGEEPQYLPWGLPTVDRAAYAELGDLILLGGYASSGKTLLSIAMAQAQARAGYRVGYYSLETSPEKMTARQLAALAQIPLSRIKEKRLDGQDWPRIAQAMCAATTELAFPVMQAASFTVDDVTADAIGHGYQVVYIDYVQQLTAAGLRTDSPRIMVSEVSQRLKRFAQSTRTAVVALAQLSRPDTVADSAGRDRRRLLVPPTMHSFKESGQLEQDADLAFLIWPKDAGDNRSNRMLRVGKNKEGPRPKVELLFHGDTQTMEELEPGPDCSVAGEMARRGRAVRQANRAQAQQAAFTELPDGGGGNPFA